MRGSAALTLTAGCLIAAVWLSADSQTFRSASRRRRDIQRAHRAILYGNCVTCHRPGRGGAVPRSSRIRMWRNAERCSRRSRKSRYMPPWHAEPGFGRLCRRATIDGRAIDKSAEWVKAGMPRGNAAGCRSCRPSRKDGSSASRICVDMPEAFDIPADGPDVYRNLRFQRARPKTSGFVPRNSARQPARGPSRAVWVCPRRRCGQLIPVRRESPVSAARCPCASFRRLHRPAIWRMGRRHNASFPAGGSVVDDEEWIGLHSAAAPASDRQAREGTIEDWSSTSRARRRRARSAR
jgi:mono/diheme cytochrome c family protein